MSALAVRESLAFLNPFLTPGSTWLDVGCGRGELAHALAERGAHVTAIDPSTEATAAARARGVLAHASTLEAWQDGPYDVILFSSSLHHVASLLPAIARAHALARPGGKLVLEEFDVHGADAATALFYYDTLDALTRAGALAKHAKDEALAALAPLDRWRAEHAHEGELHGAQAMHDAVGANFRVREVTRGPYLYRTVAARAADAAIAEEYLARESLRIAQVAIRAVGFRLVAER